MTDHGYVDHDQQPLDHEGMEQPAPGAGAAALNLLPSLVRALREMIEWAPQEDYPTLDVARLAIAAADKLIGDTDPITRLPRGPDRGGFFCGNCGFATSSGDELLAHDCSGSWWTERPVPAEDPPVPPRRVRRPQPHWRTDGGP